RHDDEGCADEPGLPAPAARIRAAARDAPRVGHGAPLPHVSREHATTGRWPRKRGGALLRGVPREFRRRNVVYRPNACSYCSGLKPTRSLPPTSSTGRLIIDGCAAISAIALFSDRALLSLSGSARNVVPARLMSVSHPTSRDQASSRPRS